MTSRPVFGLTVLRYADGRTEVGPVAAVPVELGFTWDPMPTAWEHRHAMLIDACEVVKREAGE